MGILALFHPIHIVSMISSAGMSSLVSGTLSHARASNCFIILRCSKVGCSLSIVIRLSGKSPNCSIYVSQRIVKRWKWWKGISNRPCHLRFAHRGAKPRRPVTPFRSRRAASSHSSVSLEGLFCLNYRRCSLLVASSAWVCITWCIQCVVFQSHSQ